MNREEFLELLTRTPRDWRLAAGKIRRGMDLDLDCPLSAVARESATAGLLLAPELAIEIVAASDNLDQADPSLRVCLLDACGLLVRRKAVALKPVLEPSRS